MGRPEGIGLGSRPAGTEGHRLRLRAAGVLGGVLIAAAVTTRLTLVALGRGSVVEAAMLDVVIFAGAGIGCVLSVLSAPVPRRRYAVLIPAACLLALAVRALVPLV